MAPTSRPTYIFYRNLIIFILFVTIFMFIYNIYNESQKDNVSIEAKPTLDFKVFKENEENFLSKKRFLSYGRVNDTVKCLINYFQNDFKSNHYRKLDFHTSKCTSNLFYSLPILYLGLPRIELKYFLPPFDHNDRCHVVTFGVGGEVYAETELRRILPHCTFLGVDPDDEMNQSLFEKELSGQYVKAAVGKETGKYIGTFLRNGSYTADKVDHIGLKELLKTNVEKKRIIDVLMIDIEGAEFDIFDVLINDSNKLPIICQFNVEIHGINDEEFSKPSVIKQFEKLIKKSKFLPLKIDGTPFGFYRTYWLNYGNSKCIEKYFGITIQHQQQ